MGTCCSVIAEGKQKCLGLAMPLRASIWMWCLSLAKANHTAKMADRETGSVTPPTGRPPQGSDTWRGTLTGEGSE